MRRAGSKPSRGSDYKLLLVVLAAAVTLGWLAAAFSHLNTVHGGEEEVKVSHSHAQSG
jgi:hypothetical protein